MDTQQNSSRRTLIIGFVASSLFTALLTVSGSYFVTVKAQLQQDRRAELGTFQTPAGEMDELVAQFMEKYLNADDTADARQKLEANIRLQWNALEQITPLFDDDQARTARQYQDQIVRVSDELISPPAPEDAQALMQAIATARDTRVDVSAAVQERARSWF